MPAPRSRVPAPPSRGPGDPGPDRTPAQAASSEPGRRTGRTARRIAPAGPGLAARTPILFATLALFAGLALFGARWHWVEEAGSAERDGYVAQAEEILAGRLPRDPFRPALYPLLVAGLSLLGPAPFSAARLLANAAAAALALAAFAFGRRLVAPVTGPRGAAAAGWLAFAATAVNPNLWILGQHVTTDMPFAALAAGALLAALAYLERPGRGAALAAGACLGLAAFTRANAW
ncbi:MAG TPA: hypothetical protein VHQ65_11005, partial [Thermoanaerobaculia bacterium]|nr:hypothetical protein [Thermoanaerobaculia bacterium]